MESRAKQTVLSFLSVLSVCAAAAAADPQAPEVHTELGSLRGEYVSVKGKEPGVHAFLAVPFAKPPVGPALRLAAPQPAEGWEGTRDATKQPPMCVQNKQMVIDLIARVDMGVLHIPDISEDCLYLNIYTPANRSQDANLPVMVWIHGGGFNLGSASIYDGSALAAYQDVVVVMIQYRLGFLGLLSTGDEHMSGNFGLLDQVEALRWTQKHIHSFGGDPGSVTIFGQSAGGVSVSLLLLSPLTEGLLHRGIAESGTAAMDALFMSDPLPVAQIVANISGCSLESTEKISHCLKNLDFDSVLTITMMETLKFGVTVDGHFLTKTVNEIFLEKAFPTLPVMTGVNNDEGGWLLPSFISPPNWIEGLDREHVVNIVSMWVFSDPKTAIMRDLILEEYIGTGEDRVKNRNGFTQLLGDVIFNFPAIKTAMAHRDAGAPVYLYEYQHAPIGLKAKRPSFVGSDHGDEIFTVLGFCFTTTHVKLFDKCPEEEEELSRIMMSYWGNFAHTGSPNGDDLVHWPKYGAEEEYLSIALKEQTPAWQLKKERFVFMTQTLPEKLRRYAEQVERSEL